MATDMHALLAGADLFQDLGADGVRDLFAGVNLAPRRYAPGAAVLLQGCQLDALHLVARGVCTGEMADYAGRTVKIDDLPAVSALGAPLLFSSRAELPVTVVARSAVELVSIPRRDVLAALRKNPVFLANFLRETSDKVVFLTERLHFMSFKSIRAKVAHWLLARARGGTRVVMPMTLEELATFFGVARPSLSRVFGELEAEGLVRRGRGAVELLDPAALAALAG